MYAKHPTCRSCAIVAPFGTEGQRPEGAMLELNKKSVLLSSFAMPIEEKINHNESPAERKRRWNKLKEKHGAPMEKRMSAIRSRPWGISRAEAKISALSELEYGIAGSAEVLGIDEQTVKNHRTDIRNKVGIPQEELPFDLIFIRLLPSTEKI
jgi:DNA-binding CsgD family transcriptional regulator